MTQIGPAWMHPSFDNAPRPLKVKTETVEVLCLVKGDGPSFLVGGKRQQAGDRARLPLRDAETLVRQGKAKIVEGSAKEMML